MTDNKLDLEKLRVASEDAGKSVATWPAWEREMVRAVLDSIQFHPKEPSDA